ncbi:TIGR03621 family F420-dependent LLM class oxidoreductase [Mycolicibacterium flavescens]|nr:TIGR03621 family F420-dependent LLM class oxidoreductase [Mycolicibacterium flavescens]MCV7282573.1 TIGR03621 family F420-dependent LLM class oxidoreductase [Mycolicibacterium flavescens]
MATGLRPFRFIAPMPRLEGSVSTWRDSIRRIEDLGFSTLSISDHLTAGWVMDPLTALTAAAEVTSHIRLLTLVLGNDFRHPVPLHKAFATLDVLSGGRVEIGLGAGWMESDYQAAGYPFDPASVRLARLEEAVTVIDGLFRPEPLEFNGSHYQISALVGLPAPVQQPRPPMMLGGGGRRALELAGRVADIVGVHARLRGARPDADAAADLRADRIAEKVEWVRGAWQAAGRPCDGPELQHSAYLVHVTDSPRAASRSVSSFADSLAADEAAMADSPAVLVGSIEGCVERLLERRERFGFSYFSLGGDVDMVAPIVARLAGT